MIIIVAEKNCHSPIMSRLTVRCSLPEAFMAPRTVPTTAQQTPTKAMSTMNHRTLSACVIMFARPQHDLGLVGEPETIVGGGGPIPPPGPPGRPVAPGHTSIGAPRTGALLEETKTKQNN